MTRASLALVTLWATACGPPPDTVSLTVGDLAYFEARVQPQLEERCGSSGCHGRADRPFSIYAAGQHRADPERTYLDEPLTSAESAENARRTAAFGMGDPPEESLIVQKPLSMEEGGLYHGGGDIYYTRDDVGCLDLVAWLRGQVLPVDGGTP